MSAFDEQSRPKEPEAREVEFEVVGKERAKRGDTREGQSRGAPPGAEDPLIAFVSRLMDSVFTVPGTRIRFGLDPIIGLIPGLGDLVAALVSIGLISKSAQHGVPKIVMLRMASNVLINALVGEVPVVGDLFSVWFKSNQRNYELLRRHSGTRRASTKRDWIFVIALGVGLLAAVFLMMLGAMWLVLTLVSALRG